MIEEELKGVEINPDALEAVFTEDVFVEEEELLTSPFIIEEEDVDALDIAFRDDDGDW